MHCKDGVSQYSDPNNRIWDNLVLVRFLARKPAFEFIRNLSSGEESQLSHAVLETFVDGNHDVSKSTSRLRRRFPVRIGIHQIGQQGFRLKEAITDIMVHCLGSTREVPI